jgi:hypothetical protein
MTVDHPKQFEGHRWVGDKRTQIAHDLEVCTGQEIVDELMQSEAFLCFGPDTLAEARNRGYHRCNRCDGVRAAAAAAAAADE